MKGGAPFLLLAGIALAAVAVVNAAVLLSPPGSPNRVASLWSHHPDLAIGEAMRTIAVAGGSNRPVPQSTFDVLDDAATRAPLAPEPFLARAVKAQVDGDPALAVRAFQAAERRDPRSLPAHYFLASQYLRRDDPRAIGEVAALARLEPSGVQAAAPFLAAFAKNRRDWPAIRQLFDRDPGLREAALVEMAKRPENAATVLALTPAGGTPKSQPWMAPMLATLVDSGSVLQARAIWLRGPGTAGQANSLMTDGNFTNAGPPPPFNWVLTSSTVGLAERTRQGLHALFYGQEDGALARQLLALPAGNYLLTARGSGPSDAPIAWSVQCSNAPNALASAPLAQVERSGLRFIVPANCPGQWLNLNGVSADLPTQTDVTIRTVAIARQAGL